MIHLDKSDVKADVCFYRCNRFGHLTILLKVFLFTLVAGKIILLATTAEKSPKELDNIKTIPPHDEGPNLP